MSRIIHIAAGLIIGPDDRTLLVRKTGTRMFMQPGGKIEPGENAARALLRELEEELGLVIGPEQLEEIGRFEALAANEPNATVVAECFLIEISAAVVAAREIEEVIWIDPFAPPAIPLAPLTANHILPRWRARPFRRSSSLH